MARKALPPPCAEDNYAPSPERDATNGQLPADWTAHRSSGAGGFGCLVWKFVIWALIMGVSEPHENAVNECKLSIPNEVSHQYDATWFSPSRDAGYQDCKSYPGEIGCLRCSETI